MSDNKKSFKESIHELLGDKVAGLQKFFKDQKVKFDANPSGTEGVPPSETAGITPQIKEVVTKDGKRITIGGDIAEGVAVMDMSTEAPAPLADGDYELEDGTKFKVKTGVIASFEMAAPPAPADMTAASTALRAQFASEKVAFEKIFTAKFAAQEKQITATKASLADHNTMLKELVGFMAQVLETPVAEKPVDKTAAYSSLLELKKTDPLAYYRAVKDLEK